MGLFDRFKKDSEGNMVKIADIKSDSFEGWSEALAKNATFRKALLNSPSAFFRESKLEYSEKKKLVITAAIGELLTQTLSGKTENLDLSISKDTLQFVGVSSVEEFQASLRQYLGK